MKRITLSLLVSSCLFSAPAMTCSKDGSEGFLPENNLSIPVGDKSAAGLSEVQFNAVIDRLEALYNPIISQKGGKLEVVRNWTSATVNAYADRDSDIWRVSMFGGLARHATITEDGFSLVLCHEIGHHIGGAPKYDGGEDWASNEGQADYFSTLKCLRKLWESDDNAAAILSMEVPVKLKDSCMQQWTSSSEANLCIRTGMAGMSVGKLFAAIRWGKDPKFETPDVRVVKETNDGHPATQCRLDTYFQGSLCDMKINEDVSMESEVTGTCHALNGHTKGLRPLCWFKPQDNI